VECGAERSGADTRGCARKKFVFVVLLVVVVFFPITALLTFSAYNSTEIPSIDLRSLQNINKKSHLARQTQPSACCFDDGKSPSAIWRRGYYHHSGLVDFYSTALVHIVILYCLQYLWKHKTNACKSCRRSNEFSESVSRDMTVRLN